MSLKNINIPSQSSDIVGVYNSDFEQVFPLARPIKCLVDENAKAMEHPVETGTVITDHIIYQPNEIELQMILPPDEYRSVYQQIKQLYRTSTIMSVQTRATTYDNMYIYRMPHEENPDFYDTILLSIRMREVLIFETESQALPPGSVRDPSDQSTVNNGLQLTGPTRRLPPPEQFGPAWPAQANPDAPGLKLMQKNTGVQGPAPNAESYDQYMKSVDDTNINTSMDAFTQEQLEQMLGGSR